MKLINLTGKPIEMRAETFTYILPPEGVPPRARTELEVIGYFDGPGNVMLPMYRRKFVAVEGLPPQREDVLYLVHHLVAEACKDQRQDLVVKTAATYVNGHPAGFAGVEVVAQAVDAEDFELVEGPYHAAEGY